MKRNLSLFILLLAIFPVPILFIGCKKSQPLTEQNEPAQTNISEEIQTPSEKFNLKVLYTGRPNTKRAKDFIDFLNKYFNEVQLADYNSFEEKNTKGFDVVIIDYDGRSHDAPKLQISQAYSRATVTIGVPGANLCSRLHLKTGYL